MSDGKKEYTFTWFIENYSYCWHKNAEELVSPEFNTDDLEGTAWTLGLFPRGNRKIDEGNISIFLNRAEMDEGPEEFPLEFELSFLSADGTPLAGDDFEYIFKRGNGYGSLMSMDEVLLLRRAEYLSRNTLSVLCKMWKGQGEIQRKTQISARTRIGIEKFSFLLVTENFSSLELNERKTVQIKSVSKKGCCLSCSQYFTDGLCCDKKIIVEITPFHTNQILCSFKLFLLDGSGELSLICEADNELDATRKTIQKLVLPLTMQAILNKKSEYLKNDKLNLLCECIFSTGVEFQKIESVVFELPSTDYPIHSYYNKVMRSDTKMLVTCPSALDDFKDVYNSQLLTDVKLRAKTNLFPAHKIVLCARSSVFKAMLTSDMREKNTDCIQVDDLEDDVMQQLLLFLYCDKIENLQWESAIKLYYAADKYEVKKLKVMCVSFFMENLSTSNASDILLLADSHNDPQLRKAVEAFILSHEEEVFASDEWGNLIETHPLLGSRTMRLKYKR